MSKKFKELVLYIAKRSEDDPSFGAVKLQKLLFTAELLAYAQRGKPITGEKYRRLPKGPVAKRYPTHQSQLLAEGAAVVQPRRYGVRTQKRLIPLREPDLSQFAGEEIAIVEDVLEALRPLNATQVSDWSHQIEGWKFADDGEEIPLHTVFLSQRPLTAAEKAAGAEVAKACGL